MPTLRFMITAELEKVDGKFASNDEIAEIIASELDASNPNEIVTEGDATYEIVDWSVDIQ